MCKVDTQNLARYRADKTCFGGALLRGNPKGRRPFTSRQALHIVLRSELARGKLSLRHHQVRIKAIVRRQAQSFGVGLYRFANSGNHLHILLRPPRSRTALAGFLRAITGLIARLVLQVERGRAKGRKFWASRPFTRMVPFGNAFRRCAHYIAKNALNVAGLDAVMWSEEEWRAWRLDRLRRKGLASL